MKKHSGSLILLARSGPLATSNFHWEMERNTQILKARYLSTTMRWTSIPVSVSQELTDKPQSLLPRLTRRMQLGPSTNAPACSSWSSHRRATQSAPWPSEDLETPARGATHDLSCWVQFSSVTQSCPTLCDPMDCSTPGFLVLHCQFVQTQVRWVNEAIQPSHPLLPTSPPALYLSQHLGLYQWISSSHQVAKVLEFQLQHQCFQWTFRTDFL